MNMTGGGTIESQPLMQARGLRAGYGDVPVLWDVDVDVFPREIVGLLGSNGAGKSTLLSVLSGLVRPGAGTILWEGKDVTALQPAQRVRLGITQIPEGRLLFSGLTVRQNLLLGAFLRSDKAQVAADLEGVFLLFPLLREREAQSAGTLSGGEQQMCAIGRGLMSRPRLLLIDELSLGLAPVMVDQIVDSLKRVFQERDLSIVLVEQDVALGLELTQRAYVLETGRVVRHDRSDCLAGDPDIRRAYLGL
jgi:branched-chain amino acid transport system ATP-binding protein